MDETDLLVVGGGINGVGIAREAAGRGLSVVLVEKDDLAAHTSSASSKLVHGGLRYLEQFDFKLVRESLAERERLLRSAPHIVEPLQFVLPLTESAPSAWKVRAGLMLYDRLASRRILPPSRAVHLAGMFGQGLRPGPSDGFTYWDCKVQDSRLVVLTAMSAAERSAKIITRTELVSARREGARWIATCTGPLGTRTIGVRAIVNAAGPWAGALFDRLSGFTSRPNVRLVRGSHIVLPRLYAGDHAFILPGPDRRVVFAIPFEGEFTLVGTTDVECAVPLDPPTIDDDEIGYLLAVVERTFDASPSRSNIRWSYSGIRALADDGSSDPSQVTREYRLDLDAPQGSAPLLSVIGGKITTYRRLAERALDRLEPFFPRRRGRLPDEPLPGGDIPRLDVKAYLRELTTLRYPAMPPELLVRLVHTYGTRAPSILKVAKSMDDLGEHFGAGLTRREVDYLVKHEWAQTAEDVLFRRTKLGLHVTQESADHLTSYLEGVLTCRSSGGPG